MIPNEKVLHINSLVGRSPGYFVPYFLPDWKIIYNSPTPDIVVISQGINPTRMLRTYMNFGWQPLICLQACEARISTYAKLADYYFSFNPTDDINCLKLLVPASQDTGYSHPSAFNTKHLLSTRVKKNFCNFVYSRTGDDRKIREDFCKLLMRYKKIDCPGKVLNNMARIRNRYNENCVQAKLDFISSYKFTIAFENTSNDYYITEKIFHPLMVGSIPIYWGCTKIEEYINPNAIINCHNYNSLDKVIEKVKEIDNNPDLYQQYINAKPVLPDSRFYQTERELKQRIQHIAAKALERRKTVQINQWTKLWKPISFVWKHKKYLVRHSLYHILYQTKTLGFVLSIKQKILKKKTSATAQHI